MKKKWVLIWKIKLLTKLTLKSNNQDDFYGLFNKIYKEESVISSQTENKDSH